jgi:N-acetylglucosaminyldiphosphoundecaprenol N-acetyl-beta-D-mannosaminyltransferase
MLEQSSILRSNPTEEYPSFEVHLLGRRISCMTVDAIIEAVHRACLERDKITIANYNVHSFNLSMQLPWFYNFLQESEFAICDSVGILKAIRYMGLDVPFAYRASFTLLMPKLLEHCDTHKLSLFLLGAKPAVLDLALENVRRRYPNIRLAGQHGYFANSRETVEKINAFGTQVLMVGMGMPRQERWILENRDNLQVNAILPGGAAIDRLAGIVPDCLNFLSNLGLEWFYRLCQEPKRLSARYLLGNPAFALQIALARVSSHPSERLEIYPIPVLQKS